MTITTSQNTRGDYSAEIDLAKEFSNITGGTLYAYGATETLAKANLMGAMQEIIDAFLWHIAGE